MLRRALCLLLVWTVLWPPAASAQTSEDPSTALIDRGSSTGVATSGAAVPQVQSDPFTGAATLGFPLDVPPGTGGVQPSLALAYNNQRRADSWVGYGWGLSLGSIRRSVKRGVPTYDDAQDTFELDGQELVPDPTVPNRFHTLRETYLRIDRMGDGGGWKVRAIDGTVTSYGSVEASQVRDGARIFEWKLDTQEDLDGNAFVVSYTDAGDPGARYPASILYTLIRRNNTLISLNIAASESVDRVIEFQLEPRPDPVQSRIQGFLVRESRRLSRVLLKVGGKLVRRYDLKYSASQDTLRSLLTEVIESGSDAGINPAIASGVRTRKTQFEYSSNVRSQTQGWLETSWSIPPAARFVDPNNMDGGTRLADVNGDGLPDLVIASFTLTGSSTVLNPANGVYLNTGSGFSGTADPGFSVPTEFLFAGQAVFGAPGSIRPTGSLLVDLTGDGRAELLRSVLTFLKGDTTGSVRFAQGFASNTGSSWHVDIAPSSMTPFVGVSTLRFNSGGFFDGDGSIADMNGDSLPDLYVQEIRRDRDSGSGRVILSESSVLVRNQGAPSGFQSVSPNPYKTCDYIPLSATPDRAASERCLLTGYTDQLFINLEFVLGGVAQVIDRVERFGNRFVDVNSDGLDDKLVGITGMNPSDPSQDPLRADVRTAFLNTGSTFIEDSLWKPPVILDFVFGDPRQTRDRGVRFADLNGDGRVDIVERVANNSVAVFLNAGFTDPSNPARPWIRQGGSSPLQIPSGMEFVTSKGIDLGTRMADLNGDGMTDLLRISDSPSRVARVFLNRGAVPDQLTRITNPLGGQMKVEYTPSTRYDNTGGDGVPDLPQAIQVVSALEVLDLINPAVRSTFSYSGGVFDAAAREFRGFKRVRATRSSDEKVTETLFHQDRERVGLPESQFVRDGANNLLLSVQTSYTDDDVPGPPFVRLPQFIETTEATPGSSLPPRVTRRAIAYKQQGGVIEAGLIAAMTEFGEVTADGLSDAVPQDTRTVEFDYLAPNPSTNLAGLVTAERLRQGTLGDGPVLRETRFTYDPENLRQLIRKESEIGDSLLPDPFQTFTYDAFGNIKTTTTLNGMKTFDYDPTFQTFRVGVTNELGQKTETSHDPVSAGCPKGPPIGSGLVYAIQGPNDNSMSRAVRCYDALGRLILERAPDNLAETTVSYVDTPGAASVTTKRRARGVSEMRGEATFLDGLGRPHQVNTDGPGTSLIIARSRRDNAGRPAEQFPPVFLGGAQTTPTRTFYDPLDRVKVVEQPSAPVGGGSAEGIRQSLTSYEPGRTTFTDANGNVSRKYTDPFGNVVRVEELAGTETFVTTYTYNVAGQLREILDHEGNRTTIDYDGLGRRTRIVEPDSGETRLEYDAKGNLKVERRAGGTEVSFEHDALGRVEKRFVNGTLESEITYDTAPKGIGLPDRIAEGAAGVREVLAYDALGRELQVQRTIDGMSFTFSSTFDPLGQELTATLPNGGSISRAYDARGYPTEISAGGSVQISAIQIDARGRIQSYKAANDVVTSNSLEAETERPKVLKVQLGQTTLDQRSYSFDRGDRITAIDDMLPNRDQSFRYDALNRLKKATGPYGPGFTPTDLYYSYSPVGNLTCLDSTSETVCQGGRKLVYPSPGTSGPRHAPFTVDGLVAGYGPTGNLETLGTRRYRYDRQDRLTSVEESGRSRVSFVYTSAGSRIKSIDLSKAQPAVQYLLSGSFEFDTLRKLSRTHLTLGASVVATLTEPYTPPGASSVLPTVPRDLPIGHLLGAFALAALLALIGQLIALRRRGAPLARPALAGTLALSVVLATVPSGVWAAPLDGDLNRDGRLDAADALLATQIAQQSLTPSASQLQSGDVAPLTANPPPATRIDAGDALLILRAAQGDDVDGDELATELELAAGASPFRADTDRDGLGDRDEVAQGSDPRRDGVDGDGLSDLQEFQRQTDPTTADTDGDGVEDGTDIEPRRGVAFLHTDLLGSTLLVTGVAGVVVQRPVYRPYGASVPASAGASASTPTFGFTGQRFEKGIGIYDYNARFYDPTLGRFLQPDSIVPNPFDPQSLNRYSYVRNNPINRIDPSGNEDFLGAVGDFVLGIGHFIVDLPLTLQDVFFSAIADIGSPIFNFINSISGQNFSEPTQEEIPGQPGGMRDIITVVGRAERIPFREAVVANVLARGFSRGIVASFIGDKRNRELIAEQACELDNVCFRTGGEELGIIGGVGGAGIRDPGLAQFVGRLERAGVLVRQTNIAIAGEGGRILGEIDVVTANALLQFKNGPSSARAVIDQVRNRTEPFVTRPVVTFINDAGKAGQRTVQNAGGKVLITNDFDLLVETIK